MSNVNAKTAWIIIAVIVVALAAGVLYWQQSRIAPISEEQKTINELNAFIEGGGGVPDVSAPSANPVKNVLPEKNPIEQTNPFKYKNPFE